MEPRPTGPQGILALLPFLVTGALSLVVMRAMRERGLDVTVACYQAGGSGYTPDLATDFASAGRLLDMSRHFGPEGLAVLERTIAERNVGLVLQIGAPRAYRQIPYLKRPDRSLCILDVLYNKVGHTLHHFLYEQCLDGVIVESEDMRRYVLDNSTKVDPRAHVVRSGIDLDRFVPAPRQPDRRGLVVGYLGRMSPEKNPLGFVRLAARLHTLLPPLSFRMFGEGPASDAVRAEILRSGAAEAIRFQGFAESTEQALAGLDVLVVPSKLDGRPNVIMEANACGVPVLGAPVGAIPEMIKPGRNGFLLSPENHEGFAEVLARWISQPQTLAALRISARSVAEARFDRRSMLNNYESLFRGLLSA
jgi:glycosyltransferase involved in cell wall biosynthesis